MNTINMSRTLAFSAISLVALGLLAGCSKPASIFPGPSPFPSPTPVAQNQASDLAGTYILKLSGPDDNANADAFRVMNAYLILNANGTLTIAVRDISDRIDESGTWTKDGQFNITSCTVNGKSAGRVECQIEKGTDGNLTVSGPEFDAFHRLHKGVDVSWMKVDYHGKTPVL